MRTTAIAFVTALVAGAALADTNVAGTIAASTTWTAAASPYIVTADVTVENNGSLPTLTIDPGVTVKFNSGTKLIIGNSYPGALSAVGTSGQPITFTANTGTPSPGYWSGIRLQPNATSTTISYATVRYGGSSSSYGNITIGGGTPTIDNVTAQNGNDSGIRVTAGSPTISNCTLANNAWGLVLLGTGSPNVSNTTISSNTAGGIYLVSPTVPSLQTVSITSNTGYAITQDASVSLGTVTGVTATGNTTNAVEVRAATITVNTTWQSFGLPYILTGDVLVEKSGTPTPTLTIQAGATLKFAANTTLWIGYNYAGGLQANGTSVAPLLFTANTASPTAGYWRGIYFGSNTAAGSQIAYATVSYGGYAGGNNRGGIHIAGSSPSFANLTAQNNAYAGVSISGGSPSMSNTTLSSNSWGLVATGTGSPVLTTSTVTGNTTGSIYLAAPISPSLQTVSITSNIGYAITQDAPVSLGTVTGVTATGNTTNAVEVRAATITVNTTWQGFGLPYILTGDVLVEKSGAPTPTLTIQAGATLKFAANTTLWIGYNYAGGLQANGTSVAPLLFTANTDIPTAGYWRGIYFGPNTAAGSQIAYATISYGGYAGGNNRGAIHIAGSSPSFANLTAQNNAYAAISVSAGTPTIASSTFTSNPAGIINFTPSTVVNARINYWSASTGPSGSGPGTGQSVTPGVLFDPWLTGSPSAPEYLSSATTTYRRFNPGTPNKASWTIGSSQSSTWTLSIANSQSTVVRTITGSGTSLACVWDGTNDAGVLQANGTYSYTIQAAAAGNSATPAAGFAFLDSTLQVSIASPTATQFFSNVYANGVGDVPVTGTVTMGNITSWTLDYGTGSAPATWTTISTGTQSASNTNLGTWKTIPLPAGLYTVRLSALDATGDLTQATITPSVGNFTMSQGTLQFSPPAGQTVTYTSVVPFPVTQTILLKNAAGQTVRTLLNAARTANTYTDTWDGRNDAAALLPDGPYFYTATVTDGTHTMTWDVSAQNVDTYLNWTYPTLASFNPFNNSCLAITYNFSQPGRVTLALAPAGTNPLAANCNPPQFCIQTAKYEESGPHTVNWAGVAANGAYRGDAAELAVITDRSAFAANAVVAYGTRSTVTNVKVTPALYGPATGTQTVEFDLTTYQNQPAGITITFLNQSSVSVLRTLTLTGQSPGHVTTPWDGRADNSMWMAPGFYTVTVTATDPLGNQAQGRILTTLVY